MSLVCFCTWLVLKIWKSITFLPHVKKCYTFASQMQSAWHKPRPFKHLFSTSNITSTLLNCFVLKTLCSKTKQLRSALIKLLVLNQCLNGRGFTLSFLFDLTGVSPRSVLDPIWSDPTDLEHLTAAENQQWLILTDYWDEPAVAE